MSTPRSNVCAFRPGAKTHAGVFVFFLVIYRGHMRVLAPPGPKGDPPLPAATRLRRATPITRTYGLWHAEEAANDYAPVILEAYGVDSLGGVIDVDDTDPPYSCSHQLRTALLPSSGEMDDAHTSLGSDRLQAMDGDQPTLTPTYIYMMTAAHD